MVMAYASGHQEVNDLVNGVLAKLNAQPSALFSTLGRIAARAIEAQLMARYVSKWIDEPGPNLGHGDLRVHNDEKWDPDTWPHELQGFGFHEAPRGALAHWVQIEDKKIKNYQAAVPTTWNAGPRDVKGQRGAYEASLLKTPIADPERPVEILRTIHSFDPCLACAVHVVDARGRRYQRRR
jgi:Ni,Fe-hydrogenase I large subunit